MISEKETKHIASLARIGVSEKEIEDFSHDLSSVLDWIEQLKEVDISGVEPMAHITGLENKFKEDEVHKFENMKGIQELFPESKDGYDKVKSVF